MPLRFEHAVDTVTETQCKHFHSDPSLLLQSESRELFFNKWLRSCSRCFDLAQSQLHGLHWTTSRLEAPFPKLMVSSSTVMAPLNAVPEQTPTGCSWLSNYADVDIFMGHIAAPGETIAWGFGSFTQGERRARSRHWAFSHFLVHLVLLFIQVPRDCHASTP